VAKLKWPSKLYDHDGACDVNKHVDVLLQFAQGVFEATVDIGDEGYQTELEVEGGELARRILAFDGHIKEGGELPDCWKPPKKEMTNREKEATVLWLDALETVLDDMCADEPYTRDELLVGLKYAVKRKT